MVRHNADKRQKNSTIHQPPKSPPPEILTKAILFQEVLVANPSDHDELTTVCKTTLDAEAESAYTANESDPTCWGNPQGHSLLDKLDQALIALDKMQRQVATNTSDIRNMQMENTWLKKKSRTAIEIRQRFFSNYIRDHKPERMTKQDHRWID